MNKFLFLGAFLLLFASCRAGSSFKPEAEKPEVATQQDNAGQAGFPFPEIPELLTTPEERKAWLLAHYWDNFNFADTALVNKRDITEQGFVNFIALMADGTTAEELIRESLSNWCAGFLTDSHSRQVMTTTANDYLYNPNSPFYNEPLYELYLGTLLEKLPADDVQYSTYDFKRKLIARNNPGMAAEDFICYAPNGSRHTLRTLTKGQPTVLFFYDPECGNCHTTLLEMKSDAALAEAVKNRRVNVLAVYTEGNEDAWHRSLSDMPEEWIVVTDRQTVKDHALYDLKAMPSLYLLDVDKRVMMKDVPFTAIKEALEEL